MKTRQAALISALLALVLAATSLGIVASAGAQPATTTAPAHTNASTAVKSAKATEWRPTSGAKFNIPRAKLSLENRLEDQVIAAIRHARGHSVIRMVMFSYDRHRVTDALLAVRKYRKVAVQVILNGHEITPAQKRLKRALGTNRRARSFFYQCRSACRGDGDVQHSKFVLFSHTGAAKNVVMLGSLNMKENGTHNQFNDLLTINYNNSLYYTLGKLFVEMRTDRNYANSYWVRNTPDATRRLYVLPFPRKLATAKTRYTWAKDPINVILNGVRCTGAATPSGRTAIRVNMHAWDGARGLQIASKFRDLYAAGCDVKLAVGYAGRNVRETFAARTKRGYVPTRSTAFDTDNDGEIDLYSHTKYMTINGNFGGVRNRKVVVTGSSNYQNGGQYGDELIYRVFNPTVHGQYVRNWNYVWKNHTHGYIRTNARVAANGRVISKPILTDGLGTNSPEWRNP